MSYDGANRLVNKQLDFLNKTADEQKELMKDNRLPSNNINDFMHNHVAAVENLLLFSEWSKSKLEIYMYLSTGEKGLVAQFSAIKLLILYEQWINEVKNNDSEKYKLFKEMLEKNTETLSKMDKLWLDKEQIKVEKQDYENKIKAEEYHRKLEEFNSFPLNEPSIFSLSYWF